MRQLFRLLALLIAFGATAAIASAQVSGPATSIRFGTSDPATCQAGVGLVFINTATGKLKVCSATDTWTEVGGAGGGDAFVGSPLSQFAATTSAQLASIMTDEVGTAGQLVFAPANAAGVLTNDGAGALSWAAAGGTVTTVSVVTNAGISGSVANATTTPAITLSMAQINPLGVEMIGTAGDAHVYFPSQAALLTVTSSGFSLTADSTKRPVFSTNGGQNAIFDFLGLTSSAKTFTFPDASGTFTLGGNSFTGTGNVVRDNTPTLITPVIGAATGTSLVTSGIITGTNITATAQTYYINGGQTVFWKAGTGSPESNVTGGIGSMWSRTDGGTDTSLYRKESGTGNTGWIAIAAGGGGASAPLTLTGTGAADLAVGPNGNTNPVLRVVDNIASQATGLSVTGNAAGAGVTLTVLSSGTSENIIVVPKSATGYLNVEANSGHTFLGSFGFSGWNGIGFTTSPSTTNFALLGTSNATILNTPSGTISFYVGGTDKGSLSAAGLNLAVGGMFGLGSSASPDVAMGRTSVGLAEINNGTAGTFRDIGVRHYLGGGTSPTVAGDGSSNGSIAGKDFAANITVGTGATTTVTVTFGTAFTNAPSCICNAQTTTTAIKIVTTTTTAVLTTTAFTAGEVLHLMCGGF